jgi:alkylhydroperoxidase family enzyme
MEELENLLRSRDIEFNALDRTVMCFPHIMHICVTHVIESFTDADLTAVAEAWVDAFPDDEDREAYAEAVRSDPVAMGRDIVKVIRASGLRRDEFLDIVRTGNLKNWFKAPTGESEQIPELELLCDVKSRWDSTYAMINRLRALRLVRINRRGILLTDLQQHDI